KQTVMKKLIFASIALLITSLTLSYGQTDIDSQFKRENDSVSLDWEWAPLGAVWMYSDTGFGYETYYFVRSEKDTVFKGKECKKLKLEKYEESSNSVLDVEYRYTYQENGKIYMYSFGEDEFQQLYDYTASEGDTIRKYCPLAPENCYADFVVDSVVERMPGGWPGTTYPACETNITINTFHLDRFYHSGGQGCGILGLGTSPVGNYVSFAGSVSSDMCDVFEGGTNTRVFNCYYDGNVNIFSSKNDSCISYYQAHLDISQNNVNSKIELYPNPVNDVLTIRLNQSHEGLIKIFDASGRLIYQNLICSEKDSVDFSGFSTGLYYVTININDQLFRKKIIKTKNK
ncbi:MAG: T9SS type A sorting domain-containing protein, partial [Bacteroidota bacterium]